MSAIFSRGTRVRIRIEDGFRGPYSDVWQYQNLTGEIVESAPLAAFIAGAWARDFGGPMRTLQAYRVRLDNGVEIAYVIEECLQSIEDSPV